MKLLFDLGMRSHIRHFDTVVAELERRGHQLVINECFRDGVGQSLHAVATDADHREMIARAAMNRADAFGPRAYQMRCARDYLQYLTPRHAHSEVLRTRMRNMLMLGYEGIEDPHLGERLATLIDALAPDARLALDTTLTTAERALPADPAIIRKLHAMRLDGVVVTPLVITQYGQVDLIKAAKHLGLPVVFLAGSWDNLTTKGMLHVAPDHTVVWNDIQKTEAVEIHGLPAHTVHVTGAPRFDAFIERTPTVDRDAFLSKLGLDPAQRTIVYLGSSNLIAASELGFLERWLQALRTCDSPALAATNVILRPHPKFIEGWSEAFAGRPGVAVSWSKSLNNDPLLHHTLVYSEAVVAVNTSAELEAAVLGKPVFTVLDADFALGQAGTVHFGYLQRENGGIARTAARLDEHIDHLRAEFEQPTPRADIDAFVHSFLRPHGLDKRATDTTVDTIERVLARSATESKPAKPYRDRIYETYYAVHVAPRKGAMDRQRLDKLANTFDHHFGKFLPPQKDAAILDIGCGVGSLVYWLHARGYENARGIDTSPDVVATAQRLGIRNVIQQDLRALIGREHDTYDAIFMRDVLEHIPKDVVLDVLDGVLDLLKPGGRLILQVPNGASPLVGRVLYGDFTHETAYTETSLSQVLLTCGYTQPSFKSYDAPEKRPTLTQFLTDRRWRLQWKRQKRIAIKRWLLRFLLEAETGQPGAIVSFNIICCASKPVDEADVATKADAKAAKAAKAKAKKNQDADAAKRKKAGKNKGKSKPGAIGAETASSRPPAPPIP